MDWSMSIEIRLPAEFLGQENLGSLRNDRLAGLRATRQYPPVLLSPEDLHLAALVTAGRQADINEGAPLVVEQGGFRDRHRRTGPGLGHLHEALDRQTRPPEAEGR